jgi:hypothetical protein
MTAFPSVRTNVKLRLKQGDLLPVLDYVAPTQEYIQAQSAQRTSQRTIRAANLTGALSVVFVFRLKTAAKSTAVSAAAIIVNPESGELRYTWQAGDTDVPGQYLGEFVVTFPEGEQTFPTKGQIQFVVESDLNT